MLRIHLVHLTPSVVRAISCLQLVQRDKSHIDDLSYIKSKPSLETIIDIVVIFAILEHECISYLTRPDILHSHRSYGESHPVEECRDLHEEPSLVSKYTLHLECDTIFPIVIAPLREHPSLEFHFPDVLTVDSMDRDDPLSDRPDDLAIYRCRLTALGNLVWDIPSFSDYYIDSIWCSICFFVCIFFLPISIFLVYLAFSELGMDDLIMDDPEYTRRLAGEIAELDEDIFSLFHIEIMTIDIAEYGEIFIESVGIVFVEIGVEDRTSFFYEKSSLFTIDELSDILTSLGSRNKRKPNRLGLAILVRDDLDTLSVVELVVEWYDPTVDLGDRDCIAEVGVDRIGKIYRSRALWECDNITTRGEYEYLIFEYIHLHLVHELASRLVCIDDSFDGLYPVAIFGFLTLARF